jgi:hypothetical protein
MECFICMSKKKPLIQPDCLCKTSYVHSACYKKWLETCSDILKCSVCKSAFSINFIKKFVTLEQLMVYPNRVQNPQEYDDIREGIEIPGIANFIPIYNDELQFHNPVEKTRFLEAKKRLFNSKRHSIPSYKKPYR